jgi:hypothetical protein
MTVTTQTRTTWRLRGKGYEFCNCNPGCTCNFNGFPTSGDGSCKAIVGNVIDSGQCGDVDLAGVTAVAVIDWPGPIHEGNGRVVFVVPPEVTDEQVDALAQIYTGQLGGLPWELLGSTYAVAGLVRAPITLSGTGLDITMVMEGVGRAEGHYFSNPVTGERHEAHIALPDGFIWTLGECGVGHFSVAAEGIKLDFQDSNWILYDFDWSN